MDVALIIKQRSGARALYKGSSSSSLVQTSPFPPPGSVAVLPNHFFLRSLSLALVPHLTSNMAAAHLETSKTSLPRVLPRALAPSAPAGPRIAAPRVAILSSPRAEPQCGLSGSAAVQHAAATSDWPASSHTSRLHTPANKGVGAQRRAFRVACALPASNRASVQANGKALSHSLLASYE